MSKPPATGFSRRTSPAFVAGGLGCEPIPGRPGYGWPFTPPGGWVCSHCGMRFMHWLAAERHFGETPDDLPACIEAGEAVVAAIRAAKLRHWTPELSKAVARVDHLRRARARAAIDSGNPPTGVTK